MASLTPGILSKLLENAGNKNVKVTGEHRSALLQVIEIVPCLAKGDDPWQSRGYFLKLSDSKHSAYVSVSDEDVELIYSDKVQLGQFVYVTRLDSASPVPVLRGLKPVPKRRPCVGNPVDLVSSESLHTGTGIDFGKSRKGRTSGLRKDDGIKVTGKTKKLGADEKVKTRRGSPLKSNAKVKIGGLEMRRLSLDSSRKVWDHSLSSKSGLATANRSKPTSSSTSSSPNVTNKKASSLKNVSPLKSPSPSISPLKSKNENCSPKSTSTPLRKSIKLSSVKSSGGGTVAGHVVKVPLNLKSWYNPSISWNDLPSTMCGLGKQVVSRRNAASSAAACALQEAHAADSVIQCMCLFAELRESSRTLSAGLLVEQFLDLQLNLQRAAMLLDTLLSRTAEVKHSSNCNSSMPEDVCKVSTNKNAVSWVRAAIGTNLAKFNLFRTQEESGSWRGEKCHYVVIENANRDKNSENPSTHKKPSRVTQASVLPNSTAKRVPSSKRHLLLAKNKDIEKEDQPKESGIKEAASLAEKLLSVSHEWFLKYLEDSLDSEFGLRSGEGGTETACLLGQLKRVNHWLESLVGGGDEVDNRVENLRKRLYGFLLEHVNSGVTSGK